MNRIFTLTLILISNLSFAQETTWITDFNEAKALAAAENKAILMSFSGSDWCANCIKLDKSLFQDEAFQAYAKESLVLLKLDFPAKKKNLLSKEQTKHNEALAESYNKKGSFPSTLIFNANGEKVGKMAYPSPNVDAYISSIKKLTDG